MSKPIFSALRQFVLSSFIRAASPKPSDLAEPEPRKRDLEPNETAWLFDAPRALAEHKADFAGAAGQLSDQLGTVRALISRIAAIAPLPAERWCDAQAVPGTGFSWSDTILFDGEPHALEDGICGLDDVGAEILFDDSVEVEADLVAHELFGGYGRVSGHIC